eukprot:m.118495 g.118495  ORF g.118495 m.118495 type:complete len:99 (+) comp23129_c0_seq5:1230-1526(+)
MIWLTRFKTWVMMRRHANSLIEYPVAKSLVNLTKTLDDEKEKKQLLERALAIFIDHYGADHHIVAITRNNLALALRNLGNNQEAVKLLQQALQGLRRV